MPQPHTIIGIDPGQDGGLARLCLHQPAQAVKMAPTAKDLLLQLVEWGPNEQPVGSDDIVAFVEKVGATPQMGVVSAFKFGCNVGRIEMACLASSVRIEYVSAQKWQRALGLIVKGRGLAQNDTAKKNRNKARAQELFPYLNITHAVADALLIAEYGRRQYREADVA